MIINKKDNNFVNKWKDYNKKIKNYKHKKMN